MPLVIKSYTDRVTGLTRWSIRLLLMITLAAAIIPINPSMPGSGLDPSWVYGIGEAVARKLVFGTDLIFTFGPYASIYSFAYHPATYRYVLFASIWMASCFYLLFAYLLANRSLLLNLIVLTFLACVEGARDATLLLYPLLLSLFAYRLTLPIDDPERIEIGKRFSQNLIVFLLFSCLGLLPLIKGSILILAIAIGCLCSLRFYLANQMRLMIFAISGIVVSLVVFWIIADQPINGLPNYFANMFAIASGYTEAMSSKGKSAQISIYLISCALTASAIFLTTSLTWRDRLYLVSAFGLFLFLSFKAGFVRHDFHATIAGSAIFLAGVTLCMAIKGHWRWPALAVCAIAWFAICSAYYPITPSGAFTHACNSLAKFANGLWTASQQTRNFPADFEAARNRLRQQRSIPSMRGSSDIYSFDQSYLLASDNKWSPRPVFQSYSAYTPKLAEMNRRHLLGPASPDNIVFSMQPIDNRYPSSEDGPSWPTLMGLYKPVRYQDGYVYLGKRSGRADIPSLEPIAAGEHDIGETVSMPDSPFPVYAQIQMRRTFLGVIAGIFFKPEPIRMTVTLLDGSTRNYRLIPGIGEAGFVLSPLVENTSDFLLSFGSWKYLENKKVISIRLTPQSRRSVSWAGYKLKLDAVVGLQPTDISSLSSVAKPVQITNDGRSLKAAACFGVVDYINGAPPTRAVASSSTILSIEGWLAESRDNPGGSFVVTLTDEMGATYAAPLNRYKRPDVAAYLKSSALKNSGYRAFVDIDGFHGNINIGLARKTAGVWVACTQFHYPIIIKQSLNFHTRNSLPDR